jgi:DNA processing protein
VNQDELKYWVGFSFVPGIGRVRFSLLESYFGGLESAWHASAAELKAAGLDNRSVEAILSIREKISLDDEIERLAKYKVRAVTANDPAYPARLKEIDYYPPLLYIRGSLLPEDDGSLAVVGTRQPSIYGRQVTEEIVPELARNRLTIVSGLARGIDSIAHQSALEAGGRTLAVLASGVDLIYPSEHTNLARRIIENGALISEFPLGTKPKAEHFPQRNRIMSGLSLGTLVIEAGKRSGALITAYLALEQNREVFAIPGSIFSPRSQGTNYLIQEGAKLVQNATDILEELNLSMVAQQLELKELAPADETEAKVLQFLSKEAIYIDELCQLSQLPIAQLNSTLAMLELKGQVKQLGNMYYVLA